MKGLKGFKGQQAADYVDARDALVTHLENIFSRFPFSDATNGTDDVGSLELKLDDIEIDEPVRVTLSSLSSDDVKIEKETNRDRLLEGGSSDAKPILRTREEIIAKYRNKGDAATAAAQAKDKLLERQEKLEGYDNITNEEGIPQLLDWWRARANQFPKLSKMVKDVLAIQGSAVASETAFSAARFQIGDHRFSLAEDSLEISVLFRDWINAERRNQGAPKLSTQHEQFLDSVIGCNSDDGLELEDHQQALPRPSVEAQSI